MKLNIVSGLGADYTVLERITFNQNIEPIYLDWLMPERREAFDTYVERMTARVDDSEPFYLLGYSFGGFIVQEINKRKPAEKVVILASIKSKEESSALMKIGRYSRAPQILPTRFFSEDSKLAMKFIQKVFYADNPNVMKYFREREPYYLKWSMEKVVDWNGSGNSDTIQILGDKDAIFPIKNSDPDYVIKGGTHLFPATKFREVSEILADIFV